MNRSFIVAVIVTFNPCLVNLRCLIDAILPEMDRVFIIDNTPNSRLKEDLINLCPTVEIIALGKNDGLAAAQNIGIDKAIALDASHLLLLDQDSLPDKDMVSALMQGFHQLQDRGVMVGAVGPQFVDVRKFHEGLVITQSSGASDPVLKETLIASGSLIPITTLKRVGAMAQHLFIDYVDLEWCLRASLLGYRHFQIPAAKMAHAIGDEPIIFLGKPWPSHSPIRHYYMFRNAIWLYRQSSIPWRWKCVDGAKLIRKLIFYTLFAKPRSQHLKMIMRGLWDGARGKLGPI